MAIKMSGTREKYPLSPKKPIKKTITATLGWVILFLILYGVGIPLSRLLASSGSFQIPTAWYSLTIIGGLVFLILIIGLNYFYQVLYYNDYFYDLTEGFIVIKKGVITPKEISIPYERVQDVYVDQDLWDRIFHLYDVHLSTATWTSGMEAHIDGVEKEAADGLRGVLLKTIGEKIHRKPTATIQTTNESTKS